jgi:hypothetical protein
LCGHGFDPPGGRSVVDVTEQMSHQMEHWTAAEIHPRTNVDHP